MDIFRKSLIALTFIAVFPLYKTQHGRFLYTPETCYATSAEIMTRQCCVFPPFFTRKVAKACGAIFSVTFIEKDNNITGFRRQSGRTCRHWKCVLDRYHLLKAEGIVDDEKFYLHLDKWVDMNPSFKTAMDKAKLACREAYRMYIPLRPCEFFNFQGCIRNYVNVHCPKIIPTVKCQQWKQFYNGCGKYYHLK